MSAAFCAALGVSASVLFALGPGERGTIAALLATSRLAFLFFWPAYAAGALVSLFGAKFQPLKRYGRELGLAFTSALSVHLGLVTWLCLIGAAPSVQTFIIFGIAVFWAYLLALCSIARLQKALSPKVWSFVRIAGMNYLAFAFALDFLKSPLHGGVKHVVEYLPFAILAVAGPALRLAVLGQRVGRGLLRSYSHEC